MKNHNIHAETTVISTGAIDQDLHPGLTEVKINYPKNYEGQRYFTDGQIVRASAETAQIYVDKGYGTIIAGSDNTVLSKLEEPIKDKTVVENKKVHSNTNKKQEKNEKDNPSAGNAGNVHGK